MKITQIWKALHYYINVCHSKSKMFEILVEVENFRKLKILNNQSFEKLMK
jgi:hypothetical protein